MSSSPNELLPKSTLVEAENAYWDVANMVLMDTKGWVNLPSSMHKYEEMYVVIIYFVIISYLFLYLFLYFNS